MEKYFLDKYSFDGLQNVSSESGKFEDICRQMVIIGLEFFDEFSSFKRRRYNSISSIDSDFKHCYPERKTLSKLMMEVDPEASRFMFSIAETVI